MHLEVAVSNIEAAIIAANAGAHRITSGGLDSDSFRCRITPVVAPRSTRRKASGGVISFQGASLPPEPPAKRVVAFFDGQNLLHAAKEAYDVALVFSQDQHLSEVADEIRVISKEQARWIKIAPAFPSSPTSRNTRGINGTDWVRIDRATEEACLDSRDYRPKARP